MSTTRVDTAALAMKLAEDLRKTTAAPITIQRAPGGKFDVVVHAEKS